MRRTLQGTSSSACPGTLPTTPALLVRLGSTPTRLVRDSCRPAEPGRPTSSQPPFEPPSTASQSLCPTSPHRHADTEFRPTHPRGSSLHRNRVAPFSTVVDNAVVGRGRPAGRLPRDGPRQALDHLRPLRSTGTIWPAAADDLDRRAGGLAGQGGVETARPGSMSTRVRQSRATWTALPAYIGDHR